MEKKLYFWNRETSYINALYLVSLANSTLYYLPIFQRLCGTDSDSSLIRCLKKEQAYVNFILGES